MHPLLLSFLGAIVRHLLTTGGTYLVGAGIVTPEEMAKYVLTLTGIIVGILWSLWNKYKGRINFLTALQAPPNTSEDEVKERAKLEPPVSLAKVMALLLAVSMTAACGARAQNARHTAVIVDTTVAESIFAIQDVERAFFTQGFITAEGHKEFNVRLVPLLETGQKFNRAIRAWDPAKPLPAEVRAFAPQFKALLDHVVVSLVKNPQVQAGLLEKIAIAQSAVLTALYFLPTSSERDELIESFEPVFQGV